MHGYLSLFIPSNSGSDPYEDPPPLVGSGFTRAHGLISMSGPVYPRVLSPGPGPSLLSLHLSLLGPELTK
jgi:hypothetical protein